VTLDGGGKTGVIHVTGKGTSLFLENAIVRNGKALVFGWPSNYPLPHPDLNAPSGYVFDFRGGGIRVDDTQTWGLGPDFDAPFNADGGTANLSLRNVKLTGNEAYEGGAISFAGTGTLFIERSYIGDNTASLRYGGGLFLQTDGGKAFVVDSTFERNESSDVGGAIACWDDFDSLLEIEASSIRFNTGLQGGGVADCDVRARIVEFRGNHAYFAGGAIVGTALSVEDASFVDNSSEWSGGAISTDGDLRLDRVSFHRNATVSNMGGAVRLYGSYKQAITITNSTFAENKVGTKTPYDGNQPGKGAAMYVEGDAALGFTMGEGMRVVNNTFFHNSGGTQIELGENHALGTSRDILFSNNLVIQSLDEAASNCGGQVDRLELAVNGVVSDTQYPDNSCDTSFATMPVVDLALDLAPVKTGGIFNQAYVTENGIPFPVGDTSICFGDDVQGVDEFFNARTCKQGAVEAPPKFVIPDDYPPTDG
jgi:predicted outer membrane repeat protein